MNTKHTPEPFDKVRESAARLGESADRLLAHIDRMTTQHTPGPWNDGMDSKGNLILMQRYSDPYLSPEDINEEWQANLRLVSAAPDLLVALQSLIDMDVAYQRGPKVAEAVNNARAAIAKATGGAA